MNRIFLLLLFIGLAGAKLSSAQSADTMAVPLAKGVVLHADPRLAVVAKKHASIIRGVIRSDKGFRVQIYNGSDRARASQIKIDFLRRFPGVRSYMSYVAPSYRVKVGDFRTRQDAQRMYGQVSGLYSPCMVVPDIVEINTLRNGDD